MKRSLLMVSVALIGLLVATALTVSADVPRPRPKPSVSPESEPKQVLNTGLQIVPDSKANQARLQISQRALKEIVDAAGPSAANRSFANRLAHSSASTIVAGLFMFMSISFAGVWFVRSGSRSRGRKAAAAVLIGVAVLGAATVITRGNAGPPPGYVWRNLPRNLSAGQATGGSVIVEIVADDETAIKLIVPVKQNSGTNRDDE
jgi:hypothetical protein